MEAAAGTAAAAAQVDVESSAQALREGVDIATAAVRRAYGHLLEMREQPVPGSQVSAQTLDELLVELGLLHSLLDSLKQQPCATARH
jgi:hypothetical protein